MRDFSGEFAPVLVQHQQIKTTKTRCRGLRGSVCALWLALVVVLTISSVAQAQTYPPPSPLTPAEMQFYTNLLNGKTPATIPQSLDLPDGIGLVSSHQSTGDVTTSTNPFFQSLGTNGRTCFTCHQPQNGWALSPGAIQSTYLNTQGTDPLFAPVDGADCPDRGAAATQPGRQFLLARQQLFNRGNFRIPLQEPTVHDWYSVTVTSDPTGCELSPVYGLLATPPMASFYRRPLPAANTAFILPAGRCSARTGVCKNTIMWDTREPSLLTQFVNATTSHAQASSSEISLLTEQISTQGTSFPGISFQNENFTAETWDAFGWDLTGSDGSGAKGGPNALSTLNPAGTFRPSAVPFGEAMDVFDSFASELPWTASMRASIVRGQNIYNNRTFSITGVRGLNTVLNSANVTGTCRFCHNNLDVGNDFAGDPKDTGVMDSTSNVMPPTPDFPLFTFVCPQGALSSNGITPYSKPVACAAGTCDQYQTTDPGMAWVTGKCSDLGRMKVPALRGLGSRPPFFHGGNANTLLDVVNFYNKRFSIGLSEQDILDLVNFLNAL